MKGPPDDGGPLTKIDRVRSPTPKHSADQGRHRQENWVAIGAAARPVIDPLLARYQAAKERHENWQELASWLLSFLERVHAARDQFDQNCSADIPALQEEWARLRLCMRLAVERSHDR